MTMQKKKKKEMPTYSIDDDTHIFTISARRMVEEVL